MIICLFVYVIVDEDPLPAPVNLGDRDSLLEISSGDVVLSLVVVPVRLGEVGLSGRSDGLIESERASGLLMRSLLVRRGWDRWSTAGSIGIEITGAVRKRKLLVCWRNRRRGVGIRVIVRLLLSIRLACVMALSFRLLCAMWWAPEELSRHLLLRAPVFIPFPMRCVRLEWSTNSELWEVVFVPDMHAKVIRTREFTPAFEALVTTTWPSLDEAPKLSRYVGHDLSNLEAFSFDHG